MALQSARPVAEACVLALALAWIGFLLQHSVHIPVQSPSQEIKVFPARSLTGVHGQTFVAPTAGLSRIDLELDTQIPSGEWVRVKFELARGVEPRTTLASAIAVFDRSRQGWPVRLSFNRDLATSGDQLYLRLESILSSSRADVFYHYSNRDIDPSGDFFDLDQPRATRQDLLMTLFRTPSVPKPLAWIEAMTARAGQAGRLAAVAPEWAVTLVSTLSLVAALVAFAAGVRLLIRIRGWRSTRLTTPAIVAVLCAAALAVLAWGEIPVGKVLLDLA